MITRPDVEKSTTAATRHVWAPRWWLVFPIGLVLWVATVADTFYTNNLILLPTVVLLGSFLVPVTAVVWYLDHDPSPELSPRRIVSAFIFSGVLGALAASVLEFWLVFGQGFISHNLVNRQLMDRSGTHANFGWIRIWNGGLNSALRVDRRG